MNIAQYYKDNVGLVHAVSKKGFARFQKAGVAMDYDDVFQEMSVVFIKACEGFDEGKGFRFSTYYFMAAQNRMTSWAKKVIEERLVHGVVSIEELNHNNGDEEFDLESVLPGDHATPEQIACAIECIRHMQKNLSPLAAQIIEWMVEPPQPILDEIARMEAHAAFARSVGYEHRCYTQVSPRLIGGFLVLLGVEQRLITSALRELKSYSLNHVGNFF